MQATEALPLQNTKSININKTQKKKEKAFRYRQKSLMVHP